MSRSTSPREEVGEGERDLLVDVAVDGQRPRVDVDDRHARAGVDAVEVGGRACGTARSRRSLLEPGRQCRRRVGGGTGGRCRCPEAVLRHRPAGAADGRGGHGERRRWRSGPPRRGRRVLGWSPSVRGHGVGRASSTRCRPTYRAMTPDRRRPPGRGTRSRGSGGGPQHRQHAGDRGQADDHAEPTVSRRAATMPAMPASTSTTSITEPIRIGLSAVPKF